MRKLFRAPSVVAAFLVLTTILVLSNFTFAQESIQSTATSLEEQMTELIASQNRLAGALEKAFIEEEVPQEALATMAAMSSSTTHPVCWTDYTNYTSSTTYKESNWSATFTHSYNGPDRGFIDLNGDGLLDYIYSQNTGGYAATDCVFLNNGSGWERVHMCYAQYNSPVANKWNYYGDCADLS